VHGTHEITTSDISESAGVSVEEMIAARARQELLRAVTARSVVESELDGREWPEQWCTVDPSPDLFELSGAVARTDANDLAAQVSLERT
jgi:hypothetical protein